MIVPLTLPPKSSPNGTEPALPSALARLGSSEFFLLEMQGELEVSGDKHGQLVGRLTIDDTNDGKVCHMSYSPPHRVYSTAAFLTSVRPHMLFAMTLEGQADTANWPSSLRRQDRQFTQATGHIATLHVCATTKKLTRNARREWRY